MTLKGKTLRGHTRDSYPNPGNPGPRIPETCPFLGEGVREDEEIPGVRPSEDPLHGSSRGHVGPTRVREGATAGDSSGGVLTEERRRR